MPNSILTNLLVKTHQVLSKGTQPGAYAELKIAEPRRLANVEKQLEENFTEEGIMIYQRKIIKGLKLIGQWETV